MPQVAVDQRSGEESVAALAAGFNQNGTEDMEAVSTMQQEEVTSSPESAVFVDTPDPFAAMATAPPPAPLEQENGPVTINTVADGKPKGEEEWVSVESDTLPEKVEDDILLSAVAASHDSGEDTLSRAVTEVADNLDTDNDMDDVEETVLTEAQVHASLSGGGHLSLRLDVDFSFGLISIDSTPNTDKYMSAVSSIAHSLFSENRPAGTGGHAIYNADFQPFVRFVEDDTSYVGRGKRQVVHASLPMFIIDWAEATSTRESVKTRLRNAIENGSFLSLALESA
jgi:hypothetical protein